MKNKPIKGTGTINVAKVQNNARQVLKTFGMLSESQPKKEKPKTTLWDRPTNKTGLL